MNARTKCIGALLVFTVLAQNYLSQISHQSSAQVAQWTLHEWVGAGLNVALAGALAAKAFLTDVAPKTSAPEEKP